MYKLVPIVVDCLGDAFVEIKARSDYVATVIESEEASFGRTLDRGIEIFNTAAKRAQKSKDKVINGEDAFQLYDTYGFPLDLTELMAEERSLKVDTAKFNELMEEQRERARAVQKGLSTLREIFDSGGLGTSQLPKTADEYKYNIDSSESKIVGFADKKGFKTQGQIKKNGKYVWIVLDKTCFYAEAGGQVGDCGVIESQNGRFIVEKTVGMADCVFHAGKMQEGSFGVGEKVRAIVSRDRNSIKKNHTATHLLQWALQEVLGKSVAQQGSLVGPDYLRFDFTYPKAPSAGQLKKVEHKVREKIAADLPITCVVMPKDKAEKLGAMALFGEKYGNEVRVVAIGAESEDRLSEAFSREFCGGTHVDRIGSIGGFKIIKEESISAGVRRITALTGSGLAGFLEQRSEIIDELSETLKVPAEKLVSRVEQLIKDNKKLAKELKSAARQAGSDTMAEAKKLLEKCEKIGQTSVIIGRLSATSDEQAREAIDMLKKKAKSAAVVLGFADNGKVTLLAGMTNDLVKRGLKAGDVVKAIAPIVDGGGGGRPQMAQAGGKKPEKIDDALTKAAELIKEKLSNR
ncbi:Alanine--tRNA ligase [subsurface metagenome]